MKVIKKYLIFTVLLMWYMVAISILLKQFYIYQHGYYVLGSLLSHPSMEVVTEVRSQTEEE